MPGQLKETQSVLEIRDTFLGLMFTNRTGVVAILAFALATYGYLIETEEQVLRNALDYACWFIPFTL